MKPDLVAPGYSVLTAIAKGNEAEVYGTSFSAPVVSGSAAIVRQYFEEGWYPRGVKGSSTPFTPSGSLVKAVLMNAAQPLLKIQDVPSDATSAISEFDNNQGMGALNLLSTMFVKGANALRMMVRNDKELENRQRHYFYLKARRDNELSVTLSWYDPPSASGCTHCLVNNFDLLVSEVDGVGRSFGPRFYANGRSSTDKRNNVEKIRVQMKAGHRYRIMISATNLSEASAKYSFIATGVFKGQRRVDS